MSKEPNSFLPVILKQNNLGSITSCKKLNIGFSREVYNINDKYVIKICINSEKEQGVINEVEFYKKDQNSFHPSLISYDTSKTVIPYIYTIEEKIIGKNLFDIWSTLNVSERMDILEKLIKILKKIHIEVNSNESYIKEILKKYDIYLDKLIMKQILSDDKIEYLKILKNYLSKYFIDAKFGYIHGDVHFNNIIYTQDGLKLIDFECYSIAPLDKEFDSVNRMVRNPNSLIKKDIQKEVNPKDYYTIMSFFKDNYPELCNQTNFENRLLIYDCLNSLRWIYYYPTYKTYDNVLFKNSKKLIKK